MALDSPASAKGEPLREYQYTPPVALGDVRISANGGRVVVATENAVHLLSPSGAEDGGVFVVQDDPSVIDRLAVSANGSVVAVAQASGLVRVLDVDLRRWSAPTRVPGVRHLALSPTGELVAAASNRRLAFVRPFGATDAPPTVDRSVEGVAVSRLGLEAVSASKDGGITWYDRYGHAATPVNVPGPVVAVDATADLDLVVVVTGASSARLVDRQGKSRWTVELPAEPRRVALRADGGLAVVTLANDTAVGIDAKGSVAFTFAPATGGLSGEVEISQDGGRILLAGRERDLHAVDGAGTLLWTRPTDGPVKSLSISTDGRLVVAGVATPRVLILQSGTPPPTPVARAAAPARRAPATTVAPAPPAPRTPPRPVPSVARNEPRPPAPAPPSSGRPIGTPPPVAAAVPSPPPAVRLETIAPEHSVTVVGETLSGKTVFFAMMSVAFSSAKFSGSYQLEYMREGFDYISSIRLALEGGEWPARTQTRNLIRMGADLHWKGRFGIARTRHLILTDLSGEDFNRYLGFRGAAARELPAALQPVVEHLTGSGGFILLIDGSAPPQKLTEACLNLYHFMLMVFEFSKLGPRQKLRRPVAVVFTKYDQLTPEAKARGARETAREGIADLYQLLSRRVPEELLEFFYCSAVGAVEPVPNSPAPRIVLPLRPYNLAEVVEWVATRMK